MWETICDAQAGFWLNSIFLSKFSRKPLSGISDQKAPPPMKNFRFEMTKVYSGIPPQNEKLQIWDDQGLLWNTSPHLKNFRFEMTKVYSGIPPPMKNFRFEMTKMTKVYSGIPPPPIWKTSDLRWPKFTPEYPQPPTPQGLESGRSYVETPVDTTRFSLKEKEYRSLSCPWDFIFGRRGYTFLALPEVQVVRENFSSFFFGGVGANRH